MSASPAARAASAAEPAELRALAGPVEATVLGNSLVQLIALGEIKNLAEGRQIVARIKGMKRYEPHDQLEWNEAYERFLDLQKLLRSRD